MTSRKARKRAAIAIAPHLDELRRSGVVPGVIKQVSPLMRLLVGAEPKPAGDLSTLLAAYLTWRAAA